MKGARTLTAGFAAALLASGATFIGGRGPRPRIPKSELTPAEKQQRASAKAHEGRLEARRKFLATEAGQKVASFQAVINRLTSWQYCRWVRAGAPGRDKKDVAQVEPFTRLVHP